MFLLGQESQEVSEFTGPQQSLRIDNLGPTQAVSAFNCEYSTKGVGCRRGFEKVLTDALTTITSWYNWLGAGFNRLIYTGTTTIRIKRITGAASDVLLYTTSAGTIANAVYETVGNSTYVALLKFGLVGPVFKFEGLETVIVSQDPVTATSVTADSIWQAPPSSSLFTSLGSTLFGAGSSTAGVHNVAVVITTRSGQVCPPIPVGSVTFDAGKTYTISITVSGAIAAQYYKMELAMTEAGAGSKGRYYIIPDVLNSFLIAGGGTKTLGFGMSDIQLTSTGRDTTPLESNFYQGQLINGLAVNLTPLFVKAYETRLAFAVEVPSSNVPGSQVESALLFSDAGLPQSVGLARSIVQLPGARPITAAAVLRNSFYVMGPTYTYVLYSSVDDPATWATAQLVDGQVGAPTPLCVYENIAQGIIWVANPLGLWALIGSQYQPKPISWYCEDWHYIDWSQQANLQLVDNAEDQTVYFTANLTSHPTYGSRTVIFAFNYEKAVNFDAVAYSLHSIFPELGPDFLTLDLRMGLLTDTNRQSRFMKTQTTQFLYQFLPSVASRFTDVGVTGVVASGSITSSYAHAPLPTEGSSPQRFNGLQMRLATQSGTVTPSVLARDGTRATALEPVVSTLPNVTDNVTTRLFNKQTNGIQVRLDAVGGWFLDWLKIFWTPFVWRR